MLITFQMILHFWFYHPALLYGLSLMLGVFVHLSPTLSLIIPALFLWIPLLFNFFQSRDGRSLQHLILALLAFLAGWIYTLSSYSFPHLPSEGIKGMAHVSIKTIHLQSTPFGKHWLYRCEIAQFFPAQSSESIVKSIPCTITFAAKRAITTPPIKSQDYWVSGTIKEQESGRYVLKVGSKEKWIPIAGTSNGAERRFLWKQTVSSWIESQFSHPASASFLAGVITGQFDDSWMREQFSRFGLQHLLAISGFHFAIIALFLNIGCRLFFSMKGSAIALLIGLSCYTLFLGPQASILRAWIMCSLTLLGGLLEKQTTALNSVGVALLIILGYDPLLSQEIGFQLSFAITAGILLFYSPAKSFCDFLIAKKTLSEVIKMNSCNQHAYCILSFFKQGLALTLAVNVLAFPLTLYYFHQFPWMSLVYNLFFPLLASFSIILLLLGGALSFIPYVGAAISLINNRYTLFLLELTHQIPMEVDIYLKVISFPSSWLILYICCTFLAGIVWKETCESQECSGLSFHLI